MSKNEILAGLLIALALAIFLSPFASSHPDGLERVAEDKGFIQYARSEGNYDWPGAGLVGTLVVFVSGYGLAILLKK